MAYLTPEKVRDILAEHEARARRGEPSSRALIAADLRLQTPIRNASFDTDDDRQRRAAGDPKAWQIGFYRESPNSTLLFNNSKQIFKKLLYTEDAWPLGDDRAFYARLCWDEAIKANPDVYAVATHKTFNNNVMRMLGDTAWSTRGVFKTEAKKVVVTHYQLHPPESLGSAGPDANQRGVDFTKDRVDHLQTDHHFLYGPFNGHKSEPFANTALCIVIERSLFRSLTRQGREGLNPMPISLVALAACAIHNALDEWVTGYYLRRPMKEEYYGSTYRMYVKRLEFFRDKAPNRFNILMSTIFTFCSQASRQVPDAVQAESDDEGWDLFGGDAEDDEPLAL